MDPNDHLHKYSKMVKEEALKAGIKVKRLIRGMEALPNYGDESGDRYCAILTAHAIAHQVVTGRFPTGGMEAAKKAVSFVQDTLYARDLRLIAEARRILAAEASGERTPSLSPTEPKSGGRVAELGDDGQEL